MICFLLILGLFHIATGWLIAGRVLRPANRTEHLLAAGLISYLTFYLVPIALGWATGYMNGYILASGAGTAALMAGFTWKFSTPYSYNPDLQQRHPIFRGRLPLEIIIWAVTTLLLLLILCLGLALPARSFDAVAYHMSNPIRWHMTGKFIIDSFGAADLAPQRASAESAPNVKAIWPFAVMFFTENGRGTAAAQFPFLLLALVCVRAIAIRLGAKAWLASLAVAACITVPELFFQSLEDYSDLIFLSGELVAIWSLLYLWQERFDWRTIFYPAVGLGILAGSKVTFISVGGALGLLYGILLLWRGARAVRWKVLYYVTAGLFLVAITIGVAVGPWFTHSLAKYNNPVYPFEVALGQTILFPGFFKPNINTVMIEQYTGVSGAEAYWNTLKEVWRTPGFSSWSAGLGMGMFVIGIPSLLIFAVAAFWTRNRLGARIIFILCFGLLMFTSPALGVARFSLFQPVMGFIAFAWLASFFPLVLRLLATLMVVNTVCYDLYMLTPSIQYAQRPASLVAFNLLSGFTRAAQLDTYPDQYTALDYWREEISRPGTKLILPPADVSVWFAYAPQSPGDLLRYRAIQGQHDLPKWYAEIVDNGATHVYVSRKDEAFDLILAHPEKFRLLMRRLDSHYDILNSGLIVPAWPEDALFEVTSGMSNE